MRYIYIYISLTYELLDKIPEITGPVASVGGSLSCSLEESQKGMQLD